MTNKEKRERAAAKKRLQEEGILPPDKPRLNRKKFIEEAEAEWAGRKQLMTIIKTVAGLIIAGAAGWLLISVAVVHAGEDMRIWEEW